jgi:hypothetical protein
VEEFYRIQARMKSHHNNNNSHNGILAKRSIHLGELKTNELNQPLTNRGFLIGCSLIAEAIDWATTRDESQVEGLTTAFQRATKGVR